MAGGIAIAWRRSVALFLDRLKIKRGEEGDETEDEADVEEFRLPVRDLS